MPRFPLAQLVRQLVSVNEEARGRGVEIEWVRPPGRGLSDLV